MKSLKTKIEYLRTKSIVGKNIIFKNAETSDANFILNLRTDKNKAKFLSHTDNNIDSQVFFLKKYNTEFNELYFVIYDKINIPIGTIRMYDFQSDSFCWGSWIISNSAPFFYSIESALMIYNIAIYLGFKKAHCDVRKDNKSVYAFHENFGAIRCGENDIDYFYKIEEKAITNSLNKYKKFLPHGITII